MVTWKRLGHRDNSGGQETKFSLHQQVWTAGAYHLPAVHLMELKLLWRAAKTPRRLRAEFEGQAVAAGGLPGRCGGRLFGKK